MQSVAITCPYTPESLDLLKVCLLYFDAIEVVQRKFVQVSPVEQTSVGGKPGQLGIVTGVTSLLQDDVLEALGPLVRARIVSIVDERDIHGIREVDKREAVDGAISQLMAQCRELIVEHAEASRGGNGRSVTTTVRFADEEVMRVHERFVGEIGVGGAVNLPFLYRFYHALLCDALNAMLSDRVLYTDSRVLGALLRFAYENELTRAERDQLASIENLSPRISADLIRLNFMNVARFDFEEILEIRERLQDNLRSYREEMDRISYQAICGLDRGNVYTYLDEAIRYRVQPRVEELEKQIRSSRNRLLVQLAEALKNPATYVPVVGSLFYQIPAQLALFLSAGIMTLEAAIGYVREQRALDKNGLMYIVRLKEYSDQAGATRRHRGRASGTAQAG